MLSNLSQVTNHKTCSIRIGYTVFVRTIAYYRETREIPQICRNEYNFLIQKKNIFYSIEKKYEYLPLNIIPYSLNKDTLFSQLNLNKELK